MPTIEFYGYSSEERQTLESRLRARLRNEEFRDDCVFVESVASRVYDWRGQERPFLRVSTRSADRAARLRALLENMSDLEIVRIDFQRSTGNRGKRVADCSFESRLTGALEHLREFTLAQAVYHLFISGLFDRLASGPGGVRQLADELGMRVERLRGFLLYLNNERLVSLRGDEVHLTDHALDLGEFRPWYELFVGGYAETLHQLTSSLSDERFATRDDRMVGLGSCGISRFDALPLARTLLADLPRSPGEIIDLGCGDGSFLADLVNDYPGVRAVGVDRFVPEQHTHPAVNLRQMPALQFVRSLPPSSNGSGPRIFIAAFLLHELLEQEGREAVVDLIQAAMSGGGRIAVIEVDHRPYDEALMRTGLGRVYYNPYYLLHVLTEQRLETERFWLDLFRDAGATVTARHVVNPMVDSTGLQFGCLLGAT